MARYSRAPWILRVTLSLGVAGVTRRKPVIGLAGGIGAGKSQVARILGELGAAVIDSDALAGEALDDEEVIAAIRSAWGAAVLTADGRVDRTKLRRVFDHRNERRRLEALIHPRVARQREALVAHYGADPRVAAIVLDSPLLFEAGVAASCDAIVFVDCDDAVRQARVAASRGWTPQQLQAREKAQKPLDFKKRRADYVVSNNSTVDELRRQVTELFPRLIDCP